MLTEDLQKNPEPLQFHTRNEIKIEPFYNLEETDKERETRFNIEYKLGEGLFKIGYLNAIINDYILIESEKEIVMNVDNTLISGDYRVIGNIKDIFGSIKQPNYAVRTDRYCSDKCKAGEFFIGMDVFVLEKSKNIVNHSQLGHMMKQRGCDASNKFDEEIKRGDDDYESSDDELAKENGMDIEDGEDRMLKKRDVKSQRKKSSHKKSNAARGGFGGGYQQQGQFCQGSQQYGQKQQIGGDGNFYLEQQKMMAMQQNMMGGYLPPQQGGFVAGGAGFGQQQATDMHSQQLLNPQ